MGDEYYNTSGSGEGYHFSYRKTLHDPIHAKTCYFYKDNDYLTAAAKVAIHPKRYKKFDNLLSELTRLIPSLPFGVRSVYTPRGRSHVRNTDSLMHEGRYICSTHSHFARGVDVARVHPPDIWHQAKPPSGQRKLNELLQERDYDEFSRTKRRRMAKSGGINYSGKRPKKITVMCNGDPSFRHLMLLNRKTAQTFDQVLEDMSEMFKFAVRKLYTIDGSRINSLLQLFNGPDVIVVAGHERFKAMVGFMYTPVPPSARGGSDRNSLTSRRRWRRDRIVKTRGKWRVSVTTGDDSNASTTAQVTITIYGQKGNSGPINLGNPGGNYFESGSVDEFEIFAPGIGEIYKIRIGHDGTGSYPAWYCEEVRLTDIDTGEELVFPCKKWMDNEKGDFETCREIPVARKGEPRLQVVVYEATVTTGDLWNSGTDANVYMTIYGDRGDTGVRQLIPQKQNSFKQGQSDTFQIEAVQLGRLKRIIIGHDGTGPGNGWNLERILVKDPIKDEVFNFYCGRWLDEGEDDGKIVREIQAQEEYMGDILEKRNWESLKWKFENKNQVKIISELTGKCLRIKGDGSVDASGELDDEWAVLNVVSAKKNMVRTFGSLLNKSYHLAVDNGRTVGHGKGGAFCEFRIHVQHDLTVLLESVKYPLQFVTFLDTGRPADSRGVVDSDSSRIFHVYCKGMFRNRGVVMFRTSRTQTLAQDPEEGIYGTGKVNRTAHFKIHKISENGVRMFESVINPGRYVRVKSGIVDCQGGRDEASQFIVKKYPEKGYVTLESCIQRGLYVGLTSDGFVKPTVDTGGKNVCLYPEVIEFGIPKRKDVDLDEDEFTNNPLSSRTPRTPKTPKTPKTGRIEEGIWKITVSTVESLENGNVSLVAYGDKGNTGPISLAAPTQNGPIFQSGSVDEFTANFLKAGKLFKVRLEVESKDKKSDPLWKVREVKMEDLKTKDIIRLNFNRWLSPIHDDGSLMRELPVEHAGEKPLSVIKYMVIVHTGKERGAATAANVYINLFGGNGDCGKRFLIQSDHTRKFVAGQKDVFEIEAVDLGNISKCLVGHDGTKPGDGWLLDQIIVREGENSKTEFIFPCKKWLDSGKDDRKIERVLAVLDSPQPSLVLKEKTEVIKTKTDDKPKDGEWKVYVTTGSQDDMGIQKKILLYIYSDEDNKGPIVLGTGKKGGLFQHGQTDEIKIDIGPAIKNLYKIRIGFDGNTGGQWFLEKVVLEDLPSGEQYEFTIYRWLSRTHDDGDTWREAVVALPGHNSTANSIYQIEVTTGNILGADTKADVYINIFGKNADSGQRCLHKTSFKEKPFQMGKTSQFEIEAVSLGEIQKVIVGHTNKVPGNGWYLEKIIITDISNVETHFVCNKWMDSGKSDKKIERVLYPDIQQPKLAPPPKVRKKSMNKPIPLKTVQEKPVAKQKPKPISVSDGCYEVYVKTKEDSHPPKGGWVTLTAYGSKDKSEAIQLLPQENSREKLFEPGNVDEFEINVGDIGDLYKLQVMRDNDEQWQGWHLEQIRLVDKSSEEELIFDYNCWLLRDDVGNTLVQELPISTDNKHLYQVHTYRVSIYTGNHWCGENNNNVFITIYGQNGDSGKRGVYQPHFKQLKFRKGQVETLEFEVVDLKELQSVMVEHDGKGFGAGWFLDKVTITETTGDKSHITYVFPCNQWLDNGIGDGLTVRRLKCLDILDSSQRSPTRTKSKSKGKWKVKVKTSEEKGSGTHATVYLTIFGSKGHSETIPLNTGGAKSDDFIESKETDFQITVGNIGEISKIRLEHNNENKDPSWHFDWVKLLCEETGEEMIFYGNCWLADNHGDKQICRELPVNKTEKPSLPVLQYVVSLETGKDLQAEANEAVISINIIGDLGETGVRPLVNSLSGNKALWNSGSLNYFSIEAVDLGKIQKIRVLFDGDGAEKNWFLERVSVRDTPAAILETVFLCQQWFDLHKKSTDVTIEFFPTDTRFASFLPKPVINNLFAKQPPSKGKWVLTTYIGSDGKEPEDPVLVTISGTVGHSSPIQINKNSALQQNSTVQSEVSLGDIGTIYKLQINLDINSTQSFFLNRMKLKDKDSNEEYSFEVYDVIKSSDANPFGLKLLPATRPDVPPIQDNIYLVKVKTGSQPLSGTKARIYCSLLGSLGESGEMALSNCRLGNELFGRDQENEFEVRSLDIGCIKKIKIGHKEFGRGCGWYCDRVIISTHSKQSQQYIFLCDRWLDSGCNDRKLMVELSPLASLPHHDNVPQPVKTKSKGIWMCSIVTATADKLNQSSTKKSRHVLISVFGNRGVFGPKELADKNRTLYLPGQKDIFHGLNLGSIGEIQKVRVTCGLENDVKIEWMVEQVILRDEETGEQYVFDFSAWVGDSNHGDIQREMPVIKSIETFDSVLNYYVSVHTSEKKGGGTDSQVSLTIFGEHSDTGKRKLVPDNPKKTLFKAGQVDHFYIQAVDLGDLDKVLVTKGPGEPWLLDKIVVKKQEYSHEEYVFEFNHWLSKDSRTRVFEDTQTLTAIKPSNIVAPIDNKTQTKKSEGRYRVCTETGIGQSTAHVSDILLIFSGKISESSAVSLEGDGDDRFQPNQNRTFQVHMKDDVGELFKMRIGFHDNIQTKSWQLQQIVVQDIDTHDRFSWYFTEGIDIDEKKDGWVEFPVEWPGVTPLPVIKYDIDLYGDVKKPPTKTPLHCQLYGENGTSGYRMLKKHLNGKNQQVFHYEIEAVQLFDINEVLIGHENTKKGAGFHLQKLQVKESIENGKEFIFECNQWFDVGQADQKIERLLKLETNKLNQSATTPVTAKPSPQQAPQPKQKIPPSGDWKVEIFTSDNVQNSGTDANVVLTIFGKHGNSGPLPLGEPGIGFFESGHKDEFEIFLEPTEIGEIRKIRLEHDNDGQGPGWHVQKVVMENLGNNEKIIFPINKWLDYYDNSYGDVVVEVPAVLPNTKPAEVYKYFVQTTTSKDKESGTDANVYINIIGTQGDTGKRFLIHNLNGSKRFQTGQTDSFEVEAVDIGKVQKVFIGHDGFDEGAGWKLEEVRVKQSRSSSEVCLFSCGRWLDEDKGDKKTEVELNLTKVIIDKKPNNLNF